MKPENRTRNASPTDAPKPPPFRGWPARIAPLVVALLVAGAGNVGRHIPARAQSLRIEVDPARAPWYVLAALDGSGTRVARRICSFRELVGRLEHPADLWQVPGIGSRLLHRWHRDLAPQWMH